MAKGTRMVKDVVIDQLCILLGIPKDGITHLEEKMELAAKMPISQAKELIGKTLAKIKPTQQQKREKVS